MISRNKINNNASISNSVFQRLYDVKIMQNTQTDQSIKNCLGIM